MKMLMLKRKILILALAWSALFLIAARLLQEFSSLEGLLVWIIAGGGAAILAGYVIAYFLENLAFWHNLPRFVKVLFPIALAGVFGFAAQSVLALELLSAIPPAIQGLILMLVNWLFSQRAYAGIKSGSYARAAKL